MYEPVGVVFIMIISLIIFVWGIAKLFGDF